MLLKLQHKAMMLTVFLFLETFYDVLVMTLEKKSDDKKELPLQTRDMSLSSYTLIGGFRWKKGLISRTTRHLKK